MARRRITTLGTPAAPGWSAGWLARVEAEETSIGRRICGAVTPNMTPCTLTSDHPSGRCRYHGGVPNVGPPHKNENARIHGLYARRLQRCGPHCPLWSSCAFSGDDVRDLPPQQRPICAYERDEYAALVKHYFKDDLDPPANEYDDEKENENEDGQHTKPRRSVWNSPSQSECPEPFLLHQLVLLTIMQTRAAAVLSQQALTDAVEVDSPGYKTNSVKSSAALEAFIRIAREYRALRAVIDTKKLVPAPQPMGIGSRLRPLMLRGRAALKESIVDWDAVGSSGKSADQTTEGTQSLERECGNPPMNAMNKETIPSDVASNQDCEVGKTNPTSESADEEKNQQVGQTVSGSDEAGKRDGEVAKSEIATSHDGAVPRQTVENGVRMARGDAGLPRPAALGRPPNRGVPRSPIDTFALRDRGG